MISGPRILFFADAGPEVGGGHVMRCLTLARALMDEGAECAFVESRSAIQILRRFGWHAQTLLAVAQTDDLAGLIDYAGAFADRFEPDIVVLDHYGAGAEAETRLIGPARRLVAIDDLADRKHACDLLVDPGFRRRREAYDGLVRDTCRTLLGPDYALIRPEFAAARPRALSHRARHPPVRRALVSLGLTDLGAITARAVAALAGELGDIRLDVVLGSGAPSAPSLQALTRSDRRIHLHIDSTEMAALMASAELAVGAGGSTTWERACLGLPAITVVLADNQAEMAAALAEAGATLAIDERKPDFETRLKAAWRQLVDDPPARWLMSERAASLCDGKGAQRVAAEVLALVG